MEGLECQVKNKKGKNAKIKWLRENKDEIQTVSQTPAKRELN